MITGHNPLEITWYPQYPTSDPMSTSVPVPSCPYCGAFMHISGMCPRIKSIEYYPDGSLRKVELSDQ